MSTGTASTASAGPHLLAELTFSVARDGGRHMPMQSGFRCELVYERETFNVTHRFMVKPKQWVWPGESVRSRITFDDARPLVGRLGVGFAFELREGALRIGRGKVLVLLGLKDLRDEDPSDAEPPVP